MGKGKAGRLAGPRRGHPSWEGIIDTIPEGYCQCGCGQQTGVYARNHYPKGHVAGQPKRFVQGHTSVASQHGMTGTPEYKSWQSMNARCYDQNVGHYGGYGGRGIRVCERWRRSFENFYADMGPKPTPRHSIDRIDVNGDYTPDNCRWATPKEQMRNRRASRLLTYGGQTLCVSEWAERFGVAPGIIYNRLAYGWTVERALTEPVVPRK